MNPVSGAYAAGAAAAILIAGVWWWSGGGVNRGMQRAALAKYLPEAQCQDAAFALVSDDRGIRGNGPVSLIVRSPSCVKSIEVALKRRGSRDVYLAEGFGGWNIPGRDRPASGADFTFEGPAINLFTFNADGSVLWQRYFE